MEFNNGIFIYWTRGNIPANSEFCDITLPYSYKNQVLIVIPVTYVSIILTPGIDISYITDKSSLSKIRVMTNHITTGGQLKFFLLSIGYKFNILIME